MKDYFSTNSAAYLQYRPSYPRGLYDYLVFLLAGNFDNAWDCATGNGQIAQRLASFFDNVYASDISENQLKSAVGMDNIYYSVQSAEQTNFPDNFFDLIIVGQAVHWFDFDRFYAEVKRTARDNALLVLVGYSNPTISLGVDKVVDYFYTDIVGSYWDKERRYIDDQYATIPFPFKEVEFPQLDNSYQWSFDHFVGYLQTWSAVNHYTQERGEDPLSLVYDELRTSWGAEEKRTVSFPVLLKAGRVRK